MDTKKYIIEIPDNTAWIQWVKVSDKDGHVCFDFKEPEDLTPYTDLDMEQVRNEAYEDGYKTAKVQCNIQAEKDLREVGERHYQKGLSDAWDAARWLIKNNAGVNFEAFGSHFTSEIVQEISPSEAIEKIRQYEQNKDRQARIEYNFDEIKDVIETTAKEYNMSFDEIAEVLKKIKGEEE